MDSIWSMAAQPDYLKIQDKAGKLLLSQPLSKDFDGFPNIYTNRTKLQNLLYEHALALDVRFTFNARVTDYFEDDDAAGIILNGVRYSADAVLAADGVHSQGRSFITGTPEKALRSGFAVYRSWFPLERLRRHELTKHLSSADEDQFAIWIAEDTHAILTTNRNLQTCTCFATHKVSYKAHIFLITN
jgi:2-polyprenyl-6-methoxyphenol hydroxylase-like FAD-dependent oxidoreductase